MNYLGQDRSDIQYAVKMICQGMPTPTEGGTPRIKRAARYLVGAKRLVWRYREKEADDVAPGVVDGRRCAAFVIVDRHLEPQADEVVVVDVFVDSDWASGAERKSTSGGMMCVDGVGIKHWSRTQKARALSSGEAEYYAMVTGGAEGLGMQSLAEDLGWKVQVRVWTDN